MQLSHDRARRHTAAEVNAKIDRLTRATVADTASEGRDAIVARLRDLDREWDVDRALMALFVVVGGVTSELGRRYRGWANVFRVQQLFLGMHATVGWCPPLVVLRRLGFRTSREIGEERAMLIDHLRNG